uniref:Uncharacterized protein n=1 Tax=Rhizophora mucronata TaxID=61149 RepID=A0A2P2QA23_RHIMU
MFFIVPFTIVNQFHQLHLILKSSRPKRSFVVQHKILTIKPWDINPYQFPFNHIPICKILIYMRFLSCFSQTK